MRDEALIQISYEVSLFSAHHNPLKERWKKVQEEGADGGKACQGKS